MTSFNFSRMDRELEKMKEKVKKLEETTVNLREIAAEYGWTEIDHQWNICMISFGRDGTRMNIYYSKPWQMTIATTLTHPYKGRRQLFRRFISIREVRRFFDYPRAHTGKGYYTK